MQGWKKRLYNNYTKAGSKKDKYSEIHFNKTLQNYYNKLIDNYIPNNKNISILDLGCGQGILLSILKQKGYNNITGVDNSLEQIQIANVHGINEIKYIDILEYLPKNEDFEIIFLIDVLEHFKKEELLKVLDLANKSLKKNGKIIIRVPNAEGVFGMRLRYGDLTHENCFTKESIRQALLNCDFKEVKCIEEKPIIYSFRSFVRNLIWNVFIAFPRLLLIAETGTINHILSQNMLVIANKDKKLGL